MSNILPTIKDRVLYIAENKEVSKQEFFRKTNLKYSNFTGKSKESDLNSKSVAEILLTYPEINPIWLLTGLGKPEIDSSSKDLKNKDDILANLINTQFFRAKDLSLVLTDNVKFLYVLFSILKKNNYKFSKNEIEKMLFFENLDREYEKTAMGMTSLDANAYQNLEFLIREDLFHFANQIINKVDNLLNLDITFDFNELFLR